MAWWYGELPSEPALGGCEGSGLACVFASPTEDLPEIIFAKQLINLRSELDEVNSANRPSYA